MLNIYDFLAALRRPKILVRAARLALDEYDRDTELRRVLHMQKTPKPEAALERLVHAEERLEQHRQTGAAAYDMHSHIRILTALLAEAQPLLPRRLKHGTAG